MFIQSMLHRLLYILPIFRAICEYRVGKNLPPLLRTIYRVIFSYLRTNQSAAQQVRNSSMQTCGNPFSHLYPAILFTLFFLISFLFFLSISSLLH